MYIQTTGRHGVYFFSRYFYFNLFDSLQNAHKFYVQMQMCFTKIKLNSHGIKSHLNYSFQKERVSVENYGSAF